MKNKSLVKRKFVSFLMSLIMCTGMMPVNALSLINKDKNKETNNKVKIEEKSKDKSSKKTTNIMIGDRTSKEYNKAIENGDLQKDEKSASKDGISTFSTGNAGGFMNYYPGVGAYPITIDGRVAYCLDSKKGTPFGATYNRGSKITDDVVKAILYNGYPNNASGLKEKYGISDNEARYYTQVALWQYLSPEFAEKSRGSYFDELYFTYGKNKNIGSRDWSLSNTSLNLKIADGYLESDVISTSGSSGTFTFPSNNEIWTVDTKGNKKNTFNVGDSFKIRSIPNLNSDRSITISGGLYVPIAYEWVPDSSYYQKLVEGVYNEEKVAINKNITVTPQKTSINISKTDENNSPIGGVVFGIYSDSNCKNELGRGKTDNNGNIQFNNISFGMRYFIKELETPTGYVYDGGVKTVDVGTQCINMTVVNKKVFGYIEVIKLENSSKDIRIPNTEFTIYDVNGNPIETLVTKEDGTAKSKALPYGTYILKETKNAPGYVLDNKEIKVSIEENEKVYSYKVTNEIIKGKIGVYKIDGSSKLPIDDVKFNILDANNGVIETITTNKEGKAQSSDLKAGLYYLQEVEPPKGYSKDETKYPINITELNKIYEVTVENHKITGGLEITKIDAESGLPLAGAKFKIACQKGVDEGKEIEIVSNENGIASLNNIYFGSYTVKEIQSPNGYVLNDKEYKFVVEDQNIVKINIENTKIKGILEFSKIDAETNKLLKGAKILVQGVDDKNFKKEFITEEKITTMELPFGKYEIKEILAPTGYVLSSEVITIDVNKDNEKYKVSLLNKKITGSFEVLKIDSVSKKPVAGAEMELLKIEGKKEISIKKFTTTEKPEVIANLKYGLYKLIELKAPKEYILSKEEYSFEIKEDNQCIKYEYANERITGTLEFTKTDFATGDILPGAVIEITGLDSWNKDVVVNLTSENTTSYVKLIYGKYQIKEIQAPYGYELATEVSTFEIKKNGEIIKSELKNKIIKGKIEILKTDVDTGKILPGAKFEIKGAEEFNKDIKVEVESKDKAVSIAVPYGKYFIKETMAPKGYLLSNEIKEVEILTQGQVVNVEMKNKIIEGALEFKKTDLVTGEILKGAKIIIEGLDQWNNNIKIEFTSKDKEESFKLVYGKYKITEIFAPKGYVLSKEVGTFEILENGQVIKGEIKNKQIESEIEFSKIDSDTKKIVEGAEVEIVRIPNSEDTELSESLKSEVKVTLTSKDKPTKIKLPFGKYKVTEIKSPKGYVLNSEPIFFEVKEEGARIKVELENRKIKSEVTIIKIDAETKEKLYGAEFEIHGTSEWNKKFKEKIVISKKEEENKIIIPYGEYEVVETKAPTGYVLSKETLKINVNKDQEKITLEFKNTIIKGILDFEKIGVDGKVLEGAVMKIKGNNFEKEFVSKRDGNKIELNYGEYTITEIEAPKGYKLSNEPIKIQIHKNKETVKVTFKNEVESGKLKIIKISSKDDALLEGAEFGIYDKDQKLISKITTDKNGVAESESLPLGTYYFKELKAPKGFKLDSTIHDFAIGKDKEIVEIKVVNEIKPDIPYTGGRNVTPYLFSGVLLVIAGSALVILSISRKNKNLIKKRFSK